MQTSRTSPATTIAPPAAWLSVPSSLSHQGQPLRVGASFATTALMTSGSRRTTAQYVASSSSVVVALPERHRTTSAFRRDPTSANCGTAYRGSRGCRTCDRQNACMAQRRSVRGDRHGRGVGIRRHAGGGHQRRHRCEPRGRHGIPPSGSSAWLGARNTHPPRCGSAD